MHIKHVHRDFPTERLYFTAFAHVVKLGDPPAGNRAQDVYSSIRYRTAGYKPQCRKQQPVMSQSVTTLGAQHNALSGQIYGAHSTLHC